MSDVNWAADSRAVVLEFANTHADAGGRVERLRSAETLGTWLQEVDWFGATPELEVLTDADAAEVRQLRDALVTMLLAHGGDPDIPAEETRRAEALMRRAGQRYPVTMEVDGNGARLLPLHGGLPGTLARVLGAASELAFAGDWSRLKACRNEPCHFAFADRTRNTSAAYCSPQCASQASMRAYRARQKAAAAPKERGGG